MKLKDIVPDPLKIVARIPDPLGITNMEMPGTKGKKTGLPDPLGLLTKKEKTTDELQQERIEYEQKFSANRVPPSLQGKGVPHGEYSY